MKIQNLVLITCIGFTLSAYQAKDSSTIATGTFGGNGRNAPQITLQQNGSFNYLDLTNPNKKINTNGTYEIKQNTLVLSNYQSENNIENEWKIVNDGNCLKARKNFAFYTLCMNCD